MELGIKKNFDREQFVKDWISTLRSGVYEPGKMRLKTKEDQYCCLGVACDMLSKMKIGEWTTDEVTGNPKYKFGDIEKSDVLPIYIAHNVLGVIDASGSFMVPLDDIDKIDLDIMEEAYTKISIKLFGRSIIGNKFGISLANLNDGGVPHQKIADIIEKYYLPTIKE